MSQSMEQHIAQIREGILEGDDDATRESTRAAVQALGSSPLTLIADAVQSALDEVGELFNSGEIYLPELILSGDAAQASIEIILPLLSSAGTAIQKGVVVIGSPTGDVHDIGKNIVGAMLSAYGYRVVDLGVDVAPNEFVKAAERESAGIIATSTLLSTCLPYQREIIHLLEDMGKRDRFFVICGGGPVTPEWVEKIQADGYGREATDAVLLCNQLMNSQLRPPLESPVVLGALKKKRTSQTV